MQYVTLRIFCNSEGLGEGGKSPGLRGQLERMDRGEMKCVMGSSVEGQYPALHSVAHEFGLTSQSQFFHHPASMQFHRARTDE